MTKKAMIAFLAEHFRYDTMNSCNRATSYARNVKLNRLTFPSNEVRDRAYDLLQVDDTFDVCGVNELIREFDAAHGYEWQIGFNGRSGGYMVLYQGGREPSGYRSHCTNCWQRNYTSILLLPKNPTPEQLLEKYVIEHNCWTPETYNGQPEVQVLKLAPEKVVEIVRTTRAKYQDAKGQMWVSFDNVCGKCGEPERVNDEHVHMKVFSHPGKGLDMDADFEDWDIDSLRSRVKLVKEFDKCCEQCVAAFIDYAKHYKVEQRTIRVPKTINVAVEVA